MKVSKTWFILVLLPLKSAYIKTYYNSRFFFEFFACSETVGKKSVHVFIVNTEKTETKLLQ